MYKRGKGLIITGPGAVAAADVEDMASARQHDGRDGEDEVVVFVADGGADGLVADDDAAAPGRERVS